MINYLGIDWGEKRIGLALASSENKVATPFKTINKIAELILIIEEENIEELVIGWPKKMQLDQDDNPDLVNFVRILENKLSGKNIKINFIDERLSSVQADSLRRDKIKLDRDSVAAMIILQAYLDKIYD